jgi:hypothetical protein
MTRILLDGGSMTVAAQRLGVVADELATVGAQLRSTSLPLMPPGLAARYEGASAALAQRTIALGEPVLQIASDLRRRAAVAAAAADERTAGRRLASALGASTASGGAAVRATGGVAAPARVAPVPAPAGDASAPRRAAHAVHQAVAPAHAGDGADLRATAHDGAGGPAPTPQPEHGAGAQDWACWMAGQAAHEGLPPALPIAVALARSGLSNLDASGGAVGFFGIAGDRDLAPAGFGLPATAQPDAGWWQANPDAQLAHVLRELSAVAPHDAPDDAAGLGDWAAQAGPQTDADAVAQSISVARSMVMRCRHEGHPALVDGAAGDHGRLLDVAESQVGVHEIAGANTGPEVDRYLASAGAAPGNPWCASFVRWALERSGHQLGGGGWAAVSTWVSAAQQHAHGLALVSAQDARPGDLVAYDWGGGSDFAGDGHIGILASDVDGGAFSAVEGNAGDAVSRMQRHLGEANMVFIRVGGAG